MKKKKIVYYSDPLNDDFGTKHDRPDVYGTFKFYRKGLDKFFCDLIAFALATPVVYFLSKIFGYKYITDKKLAKTKLLKTGYFIYANHVSSFDVASMIIFGLPRRIDFVGYSDPLTMPFVRRIIRPLGFLPLPTNPLDLVKFQEVLEYYTVKNNEAVVLFPEAHIWPQYTGIRDFKRSSFRYPAKFNRPILPIFFARRPKRGIYRLKRKNPVSVYIGDFIYPKDELSMKENEKYLGDECYKWMKNISETVPMDSTIDYVYIDKKFNPNYDIKE